MAGLALISGTVSESAKRVMLFTTGGHATSATQTSLRVSVFAVRRNLRSPCPRVPVSPLGGLCLRVSGANGDRYALLKRCLFAVNSACTQNIGPSRTATARHGLVCLKLSASTETGIVSTAEAQRAQRKLYISNICHSRPFSTFSLFPRILVSAFSAPLR